MTARVLAPARRRVPAPSTVLNPTVIQSLRPSSAKPVALAWAPSGTYLAVATQHGPILLFLVLPGKNGAIRANPVRTFRGHGADALHMSFSRTDFLLTAGMDRCVRLWHADTNLCLRRFVHADVVTSVAFHPVDENFVISGGCDGIVRLWRPADHLCVAQAKIGAVVTATEFSPDGKSAFVGTYDGRVLVLDVRGAVQTPTTTSSGSNSPSHSSDFGDGVPVTPPVLNTDGIATSHTLKVGTTVDIGQRRIRRKSPGPKVGGLCVDPVAGEVIVSGSDSRFHIMARGGEIVGKFRTSNRREGNVSLTSTLSPDKRFLLHDGLEGNIRVVDLGSGRRADAKRRDKEFSANLRYIPILPEGDVACATFAPDSAVSHARPGKKNEDMFLMAVGCDDGSLKIVECTY